LIPDWLDELFLRSLVPMIRRLVAARVNPNWLTVLAFVLTVVGALLIIADELIAAAIVIIVGRAMLRRRRILASRGRRLYDRDRFFLDRLGIPQEDGMIDPDHDVESPAPERLREAVAELRGEFPRPEVDLYLASLLAMEPDTWGGLVELLGEESAV